MKASQSVPLYAALGVRKNVVQYLQSSQVDLMLKSEIFDRIAVVCDTAGGTLLGGFGGMHPQEILKNGSS